MSAPPDEGARASSGDNLCVSSTREGWTIGGRGAMKRRTIPKTFPKPVAGKDPGRGGTDRRFSMSVLERVKTPADLKKLSMDELQELAGEMRSRIFQAVSKNGGHLASNLGVVELTIALHYV